jgi:glycosyltransferase involved in cell wall biosynthesis
MNDIESKGRVLKLVFMINVDLRNGGGMERTLLNYIRYIPQSFKGIYNITVVQTGLSDKERIKREEIDTILKENNIELITLDQYNKNLFNMKISILNTVFNTITETIRNRKYKLYISKITARADVVYLFHNSFSYFIPEGPIVIGSFHERNIDPRAYKGLSSILIKLTTILIKHKLLFRRIDYYHYLAYNYKSFVPKNSFNLPTGVDIDRYIMKYHEREIDEIVRILFVGRLAKCKGLDVLIEAFRKINNKGKYELHIVGSGEMQAYIQNSKIKGLIYHGQVDDDELRRIYKKCDIFVFPSICDIMSLAVLEALASGEYVIVNKTLKGVFDDFAELGVLEYAEHDPNDIAMRILKFRKNFAQNKNVEELLKKYDWKEIDNKLYTIFQDLYYKKNSLIP